MSDKELRAMLHAALAHVRAAQAKLEVVDGERTWAGDTFPHEAIHMLADADDVITALLGAEVGRSEPAALACLRKIAEDGCSCGSRGDCPVCWAGAALAEAGR